MMNGATPAAVRDIPAQFAAIAAQYEEIAATCKDKAPDGAALILLTFLRVQMVDMKLDMLAMRIGAATDPNKSRIVVPGRPQ